jgi:predicted site-specific integrase-resolvase
MNDLVTTRELCDKLKVSRQAIYKWRKAGCPTVVQSGNMCRYNYGEVVEWLNDRRNG